MKTNASLNHSENRSLLRWKSLRVNLREHGIAIAHNVMKRHHPIGVNPKDEICIFCHSLSNITREHVIPKWMLESELHSTIISSVNRQTITYNKAVVPACSDCNNSLLALIEKDIIKVFNLLGRDETCTQEDIFNIIRWLEIIEYKAQVLDCRRKYIKFGNSEYDRDWGIFPVSMMRHFLEMNPWKAYYMLRSSQRRITVKSKIEKIDSFVILKPRIPHFYFFVQPNEYIYLSFSNVSLAFFISSKGDSIAMKLQQKRL